MALLDTRQRTGYLFLAVIVGHMVLISAQVNTRSGVPMLEAVTIGVFSEVQRAASSTIGTFRTIWDGYIALRRVRAENELLRRELVDLQIRLQQQQELAHGGERLRQLLAFRDQSKLSTAAAEVIATSATPDFRTLTIDKGTSDGLRPDMAVIAPAGVVGRIVIPSARAAKVQLLIDRNAAAAGLVERSRAQGVVLGSGNGDLRMSYVPDTADIRAGDRVVSSGIDGIYPKGFAIGRIERIERRSGAYRTITVRPAVDFSALEEVLVVLTPPPVRAVREGGA